MQGALVPLVAVDNLKGKVSWDPAGRQDPGEGTRGGLHPIFRAGGGRPGPQGGRGQEDGESMQGSARKMISHGYHSNWQTGEFREPKESYRAWFPRRPEFMPSGLMGPPGDHATALRRATCRIGIEI